MTFLFTDVEGSTKLFREFESGYAAILSQHHEILQRAISAHRGVVVKTEGDGCFAAFGDANDGISAAVAAQLGIDEHPWPQEARIRVRMGLHTGQAEPAGGDYTALAVHLAARVAAAAHGGQVICSAATATAVAETTRATMGIELRDLGPHGLRDFPQLEDLYQVVHPRLADKFPPLRAISPHTHNLPLQRTTFVGRQHELRDVRKLIETADLVTLTGAGGVGKTRLALQIAGQLVSSFADGAWLVELTSVQAPSAVVTATAEVLGVIPVPGRDPMDTLGDALRSKSLLLLLDNCEHLLDACAELADRVLRSCAGVRILATSRERIGIPAEVVWRIPSMSVPGQDTDTPELLLDHDAVRLFLERASHTFPEFSPNEENVAAVAEICRRLDGIPLAIELAAARVGSMPPVEIANRLDDRFRLLTEGNRAAPPRHRTLLAALEWSVDLLSASERRLFDRLGVFAGTWSLAAAETVCRTDEPESGILGVLARLIESSLVDIRADDADPRYAMLETVRELAGARLSKGPDAAEMKDRHLQWYLELAERADLEGNQQHLWLERLRADSDNLRLALSYACEVPQRGVDALRLATRMAPFWRIRGELSEGFAWLERTLAAADPGSPDRAEALLGAGGLAVMRGDYATGRSYLNRSADLFQTAGNVAGAARTGLDLAWVAWHEGDIDRAATLLEGYLDAFEITGDAKGLADAHRMLGVVAAERHDTAGATRHLDDALVMYRRIGDDVGAAAALASLGITAEYRGDLDTACDLMAESLEIARRCGDARRVAGALDNLGFFWQQRGNLERARELHEESLAISRTIGDPSLVAAALTNLGSTARQRGDLADARAALTESLSIARDTGDRSRDVADVLEELAAVRAADGDDRGALALFAAAEAVRDAVEYPLREFFRRMYDPIIAAARGRISDPAEVWAAGRRLSIADAISLALTSPAPSA